MAIEQFRQAAVAVVGTGQRLTTVRTLIAVRIDGNEARQAVDDDQALTGAIVVFLHLGSETLAVIGVCLSVAAADRHPVVGADGGNVDTGPKEIGCPAGAVLELTERALGAEQSLEAPTFLSAFAIGSHIDARRSGLASVAVGLPVTATHGRQDERTRFRLHLTDTGSAAEAFVGGTELRWTTVSVRVTSHLDATVIAAIGIAINGLSSWCAQDGGAGKATVETAVPRGVRGDGAFFTQDVGALASSVMVFGDHLKDPCAGSGVGNSVAAAFGLVVLATVIQLDARACAVRHIARPWSRLTPLPVLAGDPDDGPAHIVAGAIGGDVTARSRSEACVAIGLSVTAADRLVCRVAGVGCGRACPGRVASGITFQAVVVAFAVFVICAGGADRLTNTFSGDVRPRGGCKAGVGVRFPVASTDGLVDLDALVRFGRAASGGGVTTVGRAVADVVAVVVGYAAAGSVGGLGDPRQLPQAVIPVGVSVAAADGGIERDAARRFLYTGPCLVRCARCVRRVARPVCIFTKQALGTLFICVAAARDDTSAVGDHIDAGRFGHAVIAVGVSVTAAHGEVFLGAEVGDENAGPFRVAARIRFLAVQRGVTAVRVVGAGDCLADVITPVFVCVDSDEAGGAVDDELAVTLAFMVFLDLGHLSLAIVAVGLGVAPADRLPLIGADLWNSQTLAGSVADIARSRRLLTPVTIGAGDAGDGAACTLAFAEGGNIHAGFGGFALIAIGLVVASAHRDPTVRTLFGARYADPFRCVATLLGTILVVRAVCIAFTFGRDTTVGTSVAISVGRGLSRGALYCRTGDAGVVAAVVIGVGGQITGLALDGGTVTGPAVRLLNARLCERTVVRIGHTITTTLGEPRLAAVVWDLYTDSGQVGYFADAGGELAELTRCAGDPRDGTADGDASPEGGDVGSGYSGFTGIVVGRAITSADGVVVERTLVGGFDAGAHAVTLPIFLGAVGSFAAIVVRVAAEGLHTGLGFLGDDIAMGLTVALLARPVVAAPDTVQWALLSKVQIIDAIAAACAVTGDQAAIGATVSVRIDAFRSTRAFDGVAFARPFGGDVGAGHSRLAGVVVGGTVTTTDRLVQPGTLVRFGDA